MITVNRRVEDIKHLHSCRLEQNRLVLFQLWSTLSKILFRVERGLFFAIHRLISGTRVCKIHILYCLILINNKSWKIFTGTYGSIFSSPVATVMISTIFVPFSYDTSVIIRWTCSRIFLSVCLPYLAEFRSSIVSFLIHSSIIL